jgi:transposase-like protein
MGGKASWEVHSNIKAVAHKYGIATSNILRWLES